MNTANKTKITPFVRGLAVVVACAVALCILAVVLHRDPPPTVASMMADLDIPAVVPAETLGEAVREKFLTAFGSVYGIDPEPEETAYFTKLLKENPAEFELEEYLHDALLKECIRRRIPEKTLIRQITGIRDPAEREKIRREWSEAGKAAVLDSEDFLRVMEPVFAQFYAWWTKRHPEYDGIAMVIKVTDDHESLMEQLTVALWRETLVSIAQQLQARLESDLRARGKVLSDAKRKRTFALFLRLSRERYTKEMMRKMADAIVTETELTDDEVFGYLLQKSSSLSEERLTKIQDIQVRYLTPGMLNEIPPETMAGILKELEEITGVGYGTR